MPGSGKTTLCKKLSKSPQFIVQDIDDITDKIALKILETKKYDYMFNGTSIREFDELINNSFYAELDKLREKAKKKRKF